MSYLPGSQVQKVNRPIGSAHGCSLPVRGEGHGCGGGGNCQGQAGATEKIARKGGNEGSGEGCAFLCLKSPLTGDSGLFFILQSCSSLSGRACQHLGLRVLPLLVPQGLRFIKPMQHALEVLSLAEPGGLAAKR